MAGPAQRQHVDRDGEHVAIPLFPNLCFVCTIGVAAWADGPGAAQPRRGLNMVFRRSKPGVIGRAATTAARTALITATATTVANKMAPRAGAAPAAEPVPAATPAEAAPKGLTDEAIAQLQKLAELNKAGILTDEEFATQKARILG